MFEMQKAKLETIEKERKNILQEIGKFLTEVCNEVASMCELVDCNGDEMTEFSFIIEDGKIWFDYSIK